MEEYPDDVQAQQNANFVAQKRKAWKQQQHSCVNNENEDPPSFTQMFEPPPSSISIPLDRDSQSPLSLSDRIQSPPCPHIFLDLGANRGDSLSKFIQAGIPCSSSSFLYNGTTGRITPVIASTTKILQPPKNTKKVSLTQWIQNVMMEYQQQQQQSQASTPTTTTSTTSRLPPEAIGPEHYCYYGVEGNPIFTQPLRALEYRVQSSIPRPVRSAFFLTETVASGNTQITEGSTIPLYLDTVNVANHYFGSSLLSTHTDVRNSARKHNDGIARSVPVQSWTLSTLLRTMVRIDRSTGSHVIIKIDIEGAEYELLNEAYDSGVLCHDLVSNGVRADIRVEIHPKKTILGNTPRDDSSFTHLDRFKNKVRFQLQKCGVHLDIVGDAG
jgi:hypothetical protein